MYFFEKQSDTALQSPPFYFSLNLIFSSRNWFIFSRFSTFLVWCYLHYLFNLLWTNSHFFPFSSFPICVFHFFLSKSISLSKTATLILLNELFCIKISNSLGIQNSPGVSLTTTSWSTVILSNTALTVPVLSLPYHTHHPLLTNLCSFWRCNFQLFVSILWLTQPIAPKEHNHFLLNPGSFSSYLLREGASSWIQGKLESLVPKQSLLRMQHEP